MCRFEKARSFTIFYFLKIKIRRGDCWNLFCDLCKLIAHNFNQDYFTNEFLWLAFFYVLNPDN